MTLCARCAEVHTRKWVPGSPVPRGIPTSWTFTPPLPGAPKTFRGFVEDCVLCGVLKRIVATHDKNETGPSRCLLVYHTYSLLFSAEGQTHRWNCQLFTAPDLLCPYDIVPPRRFWNAELSQDSCDEAISRWMNDCSTRHSCGAWNVGPLPTRVIDVGDSQNEYIKLVHTSGMQGQYICLSHCWGSHVVLRTTTDNLPEHLQAIPWDNLPKTFQDAIVWTRKLKIRYLWIDSLAIIQDDREDWEKEAAQMARIYSNSYVTLAATGSADGTKGLLCPPTRSVDRHSGINYDGNPYEYLAFTEWFRHPDPRNGVKEFPLMTRGWCFQERILSPRTIHFNSNELSWECFESSDCQCGEWREKTDKCKALYSQSNDASTKGQSIIRWAEVVSQYSKLSLTYTSDKSAAIAGIAAKEASLRPGVRYYSGLWSDTLLSDLLWSPSGKLSPQPTTWRGPSWSWISGDGNIHMRNHDIPENATSKSKILETRYSVGSINPYDTPKVAEIMLRGFTVETLVQKGKHRPVQYLLRNGQGYRPVEQSRSDLDNPEDYFPSQTATDEKTERTKTLSIRIYQTDDPFHMECLVLSCVDQAKQIYKRIGVFVCPGDPVDWPEDPHITRTPMERVFYPSLDVWEERTLTIV